MESFRNPSDFEKVGGLKAKVGIDKKCNL
jgi:hypothetical protein